MYRLRILILAGLLLLPVLGIEARLFQLQVLEGARYREESERKVTTIEILPSMRGRIVDRNGVVLARDERSFEIQIVPQRLRPTATTPREVIATLRLLSERVQQNPDLLDRPVSTARLAQFFRVRRESLEDALAQVQKHRTLAALAALLRSPSRPWEERLDLLEARVLRLISGKSRKDAGRIARAERENPLRLVGEVTFDQAAEIETHAEVFVGLQAVERLKRVYPWGRAGAHVVGYVGKMNDAEYAQREGKGYFRAELLPLIGEEEYALRERLGHFKADMVGKAGLEAWFDEPDGARDGSLRGRRGAMIQSRDLASRTREILQHVPPQSGRDLALTLDMRLQREVENLLAGVCGSAVVMDVRNGEVLVLASSPGFDSNDFMPPVSPQVVERLFGSKDHPLLNRAVQSAYPLGSVFKVVTAIAGLEEHKIDPASRFTCEGRYRQEPPYFRCWIAASGGGHGAVTLAEALMHSCNVFFCNVGARVGGEALSRWASRLGLGRTTGIDLPGERAGRLPGRVAGSAAEPAAGLGAAAGAYRGMTPNELLNLSIGQGQIEVTSIQVAVLLAAVANGGRVLRPVLTRDDPGARELDRLDLAPGTLATVRAGLAAVVNEPGGTAHKTDLKNFRAAGKTSTAEVTSSETARQHPAFYPHAWFAGYAPHDAPRVAFVVMVEHGGKGSEAAAIRSAQMLAHVFRYYTE